MKSLIIVDKRKEKEYEILIQQLSIILGEYGVIDKYIQSEKDMPHTRFLQIQKFGSDVLFVIDCSGFDILTTGGILGYNKLPCRIVHLIMDESAIRDEYTNKRMNLSTFVYVKKTYFADKFDVDKLGMIQVDTLPEDFSVNIEAVHNWVKNLIKDLELTDK